MLSPEKNLKRKKFTEHYLIDVGSFKCCTINTFEVEVNTEEILNVNVQIPRLNLVSLEHLIFTLPSSVFFKLLRTGSKHNYTHYYTRS